ncbi:hypothetical protein [Pusillimonas sp. NJUB218]|uniref:hypothetical protein n=1 Tax=Pusillimonas sp. NJUB218 TaxID=2023230 RepID=UPI000F4D1A5C|nr:hypothetical protein [Pusillimonas sp. NJUB218]ROT46754.1 hypothetical protein CHR62_02215 [Pusillimonas sp. NJUB218]
MNDEPYVEELRLLLAQGEPFAPKAARLRPLLPRIVQRLAAGAPRKVIVEQLNRAGLDISLHDLAKQLYQHRKARRAGEVNTVQPSPPGLPPAAPDAAVRGQPNRIENPADLRKIRSMEVDLDALRREGEAMRRQARHAKAGTDPTPSPAFPNRSTPQE